MLQLEDIKLKCSLSIAQLSINGILSLPGTLHGILSPTPTWSGNLSLTSNHEVYTGDTTVTPSIHSQTLETRNKIVPQDVNIKEIPTYEVSNEYGTTIYIAKELDD